MKDTSMFTISTTINTLSNILCSDYKVDSSSAEDLLSILKLGSERMGLFVQEYIPPLPITGPKKAGNN